MSMPGEDIYWIPQGGAMADAKSGVDILGAEIEKFLLHNQWSLKTWKCHVFVESGTGVTALLLHQYFKRKLQEVDSSKSENFPFVVEVTAVSCVMSPVNLLRNMAEFYYYNMGVPIDNFQRSRDLPSVLSYPSHITDCDAVPFGTPCSEHLKIWNELNSTSGIEFDLLYAPKAFQQIYRYWDGKMELLNSFRDDMGGKDDIVIYLHCGGVEGNASQLSRYKFRNMVS